MIQVAVIGGSNPDEQEYHTAYELGCLLSGSGVALITGGLGGVMEAVCRGIKTGTGLTIAIVPETEGNRYSDIVIRTRMGHARNTLIAGSADIVIAIGGEYGTLSEIALSLKDGKPVLGLNTWDIEGVITCSTPQDAIRHICQYFPDFAAHHNYIP